MLRMNLGGETPILKRRCSAALRRKAGMEKRQRVAAVQNPAEFPTGFQTVAIVLLKPF
jgi:hypothetical protein